MDQKDIERTNSDSSEEKFNIEFGYRKVRIEHDIPGAMHETMQLSDIQFYIPIYNKFFQMNEKNANRITLKHALRATRFIERKSTSVYSVDVVNDAVSVKTSNTTNTTTMSTFIKCTPLFDPLKYLCTTEKERASSNQLTTELFLPQFLDFETAHELFKTTFCFWLTAKEYEAAINSFQFDHSVGIRIDEIVGAAHFADLAYNRFPMILVGPTGLSYRFLMHGFFVEHAHAHLERMRLGMGLKN